MQVRMMGIIVVAALLLHGGVAHAQAYPSKPVRLVVPFPAGGGTDLLARTLGKGFSEIAGQQFVIDNRGGAAGNIGADVVAHSSPDGYTLLLGTNTLAINATLYQKLPFDPLKDFAPVALVAISPNVLAVHPSLPVRDVKQLIAFAKARPGKLSYASQGNGGTGHLAGELFKKSAGVELVHVPYKGAAPALTDLIAGNVDLAFVGISALPHARSGRLRALAVTTPRRSTSAPEVPTVAEAGLPGYEATTWFGILAPGTTPPAIVAILNQHIGKVTGTASVNQVLTAQGFEVAHSSAAEFSSFFRAEIIKWGEVGRAAGAKVE